MLLGCIGDDFTGSSDIANTLAKGGMRVTQYTGIPNGDAGPDVEAGVVSLKTRTVPADEAVRQSLEAANWLLRQGCEQIVFKICSTFDSTPKGNIGPVAGALADLLGEERVVVCPAFPGAGRTVFQGHLFVGDTLLSESGMKNHPLTPMTDPDLRRWLAMQTDWPVGHIAYEGVTRGADHLAGILRAHDRAMIVVDAILDKDLMVIGAAAADRKLLTGGSGIALGLPENFRRSGRIGASKPVWTGADGRAAILSGSCSVATRGQINRYAAIAPSLEITADAIMSARQTAASVCGWVLDQKTPPLVFTSADPDTVRAAQTLFGRERLAGAIESFFGELACLLVAHDVSRLVVAGGETSGAVVMALGIDAMQIGPEIAPGVPALKDEDRPLVLALKSGNFGGENFFSEALEVLAK